jgi:hypothetical protein
MFPKIVEVFFLDLQAPSPDYALVTAIEGRALQSEGNEPVPWSGLQTELLERMPGKKCERRAKHQRRH